MAFQAVPACAGCCVFTRPRSAMCLWWMSILREVGCTLGERQCPGSHRHRSRHRLRRLRVVRFTPGHMEEPGVRRSTQGHSWFRPSPGRRVLPCGEPGRRQPPLVVRQHAAGPGCLAQERDEDRGLCPRASARQWNPLSHAAATNTAAVCATPHGRPVCRTRFPASQRGFPCFAALAAHGEMGAN